MTQITRIFADIGEILFKMLCVKCYMQQQTQSIVKQ